MAKDNNKLKKIVSRTFKRVTADLIIGILFYAFIQIHWIFAILFYLFIIVNFFVIIYSAIYSKDFKPFIYSLIANWIGESNGK